MTEKEGGRGSSNRLVFYQQLVQELLRPQVNEKKIKQLMQKLGLKYSTQSVDRLSEVLAFNPLAQAEKGLNHDL